MAKHREEVINTVKINMDTKRRDKVWFANKYIAFLENEFGRTKESYYAFFDNDDFPNECWG